MGEKLKIRLKQDKFTTKEKEATLNLFLAYNCIRQKIDRICGNHGITNAQYNVLRILKGVYPDGHARCDISMRMVDPSPDVTRIIDNLEKQRLIERFNSNEDRRLSVARITKKGLELLEAMNSEVDEVDKHLKANLSEAEISQLSEICEKLYEVNT